MTGGVACAPFEDLLGHPIEGAVDGWADLYMPFTVKLSQGVEYCMTGR